MNYNIAISVLLPFISGRNIAVPFTIAHYMNKSSVVMYLINSNFSEYTSISLTFEHQYRTRVILFCVRVPVLSEHIIEAPPIVSHAAIFRTRLLSFNILLVEYASDKVTDNGKPSGIATTTTVIPIIKKLSNSPTF